jgi:hypothetical protein
MGYTSGRYVIYGFTNRIIFYPVTVTSTSVIASLTGVVASPGGNVQYAIYDANAGKPNNLLANTPITAVTTTTQTATLISPVTLTPGTYFIGCLFDAANVKGDFLPTGVESWFSASVTLGSLPSNASGLSSFDNFYPVVWMSTLVTTIIPILGYQLLDYL